MGALPKKYGATLMVAGTSIGAGMLGLPLKTASLGLLTAGALFTIVCVVMIASAYFLAKVALDFPKTSNLITFSESILGKNAARFIWVIYALFFISIMSAYTSGGASLLQEIVFVNSSVMLSKNIAVALFLCPLAFIVAFKSSIVDITNRALLGILIASYFYIVYLFIQKTSSNAHIHTNLYHLSDLSIKEALTVLPIVVTSFGFHGLIPSLRDYLNKDKASLYSSIVNGALLALGIYLIWEIVILCHLSQSDILHLQRQQGDFTEGLVSHLGYHSTNFAYAVALFSFSALASSFLGVGLSLFDFFNDGLKLPDSLLGKFLGFVLTFFLPCLFTFIVPNGFLYALKYAGMFAATLLIIIPSILYLKLPSQSKGNILEKSLAYVLICIGTIIVIVDLL